MKYTHGEYVAACRREMQLLGTWAAHDIHQPYAGAMARVAARAAFVVLGDRWNMARYSEIPTEGAECWIPVDGEQSALILHPSTEFPGGWRLTSWDHTGPCGHTEHEDRAAAVTRLHERVGPWPAVPDFEIEARPGRYRRVAVEPPWLGLTVITSGVIEQEARPGRMAT